ncbi:MAG: HD domain-containing protein [Nitrospiraceae bacterium]|nr:MAG: HD domain-containing protein [Nitrospiraceae bacterium]
MEYPVKTETENKAEDISGFITALVIAISNYSLYSKEHESFGEFAGRCFSALQTIMQEKVEIMIFENELIVNRVPVRNGGLHINNLIARMRKKGVLRVEILQGVSHHEMTSFIMDMAQTGQKLKGYPNIMSGSVDFLVSSAPPEGYESNSVPAFVEEGVEKVRSAFGSGSVFRQVDIKGLEDVVMGFISVFRREASILKYLSPVKSFSEYTYTHATNVSLLSVLQAESLGIGQEFLYEIGLAALLHDAGKLFVPKEILEKQGKLESHEFEEIKKHPLYGARYLAKITSLPHIVPVIAFEHHIKYDGTGYPSPGRNDKKQHVYSQIVAIADFFDALRSRRPYRESMEIEEIFVLMKKCSGTDFNPFLIDNFINLIHSSLNK